MQFICVYSESNDDDSELKEISSYYNWLWIIVGLLINVNNAHDGSYFFYFFSLTLFLNVLSLSYTLLSTP